MDKYIQEKARRFAAQCDKLDFDPTTPACSVCALKKRSRCRDYGLLLSLCGVMICNQFNLGVGQAVCHGFLNVFMNKIAATQGYNKKTLLQNC